MTDRRLVFRPTLFERMTEEVPWQGELGHLLVTVGPGPWRPRVPLLRKLALRYDVEAMDSHGTDEHFFVTHLGHDLQRVAVERIQE